MPTPRAVYGVRRLAAVLPRQGLLSSPPILTLRLCVRVPFAVLSVSARGTALLRDQHAPLTVTSINRILKQRGLVGNWNSHAPALERFEPSALNLLWRMDGKGESRASDGTCYALSILHDLSR